ncbi:hypothetical protein ACOJQI_05970 [Bacillus salacetis]|uniref:hypothetical protein n=1 Tax=Bacillus salacetis TaxID=2315464 RepID=UPI003BA2959A
MVNKKWKDEISIARILLGLILLIILLAGWSYYRFVNLSLYEMTSSSVIYEGKTYAADVDLYEEFAQEEGDMGELIGKVGSEAGIDDWLFGIKVYRVEGLSEKDALYVSGLMFQSVYRQVEE